MPKSESSPRINSVSAGTDAQIIRRAQQGDAAAFERIYQLHSRKVYGLCFRMTSKAQEAEDLTQEAFLQLFRKIHTFRGQSAFSTWLYRLTVNIVLMRLRKKGLKEFSLDDRPDANDDTPRFEVATRDLRLGGVIDRLQLQPAIDQLPPGYRAMFILHDVQGYDHHEIAEIMGCSVGNSKSQVHKARMRLRWLLKHPQRRAFAPRYERGELDFVLSPVRP